MICLQAVAAVRYHHKSVYIYIYMCVCVCVCFFFGGGDILIERSEECTIF